MRVREDYRSLNGTEKAAILLLSLGEDHVTRMFELMDDDEIRELSSTMASLGTVSRDAGRAVIHGIRREDFVDRFAGRHL